MSACAKSRRTGSALAKSRRTGVHRPPSLGRPTDTSGRVAVRVFVAPEDPSQRRHQAKLPAQLSEDPGRDKCSDEDSEPDANHAQHAITARRRRNRVFPSKKVCFPLKAVAATEGCAMVNREPFFPSPAS